MTSRPVKRHYHSPVRAAQVELTRTRVLAAASELFLTEGYAPTSLSAIATRAGVARETVYKLFGGKSELLKRLYDETVAGDADQVAIVDRKWWQQMLATQPRELIATFASANAEVGSRLTPMLAMIAAGAMAGDSDLRELRAIGDAERLAGVRQMIDALVAQSGLRRDLDPEEAADIAWALISPEMWLLLSERRGWDSARYAAWLERSLVDSLIQT